MIPQIWIYLYSCPALPTNSLSFMLWIAVLLSQCRMLKLKHIRKAKETDLFWVWGSNSDWLTEMSVQCKYDFLGAPPPSTPPTVIHASNYSAFITMLTLKCIGGERKKRTPFDFEGQIVTDISYVSSVQIQYLRRGWEHRSRWWQPVGERGEQLIILGRCRQKSVEKENILKNEKMNPGWSWGKTYFGVKSHIMVHWRYLANTSKQIYDDQANSAAFGFQDITFNSRNLLPVFYALDKFNYIKDEKVISSDIWVQQIWWISFSQKLFYVFVAVTWVTHRSSESCYLSIWCQTPDQH